MPHRRTGRPGLHRTFSLENFQQILSDPAYRSIAGRTILIAALVTVTDGLLAFPIAFTMARMAGPRARAVLGVAVLMPLWTSYLVKILSWRLILSNGGVLNWVLRPLHLAGRGSATPPCTWCSPTSGCRT